LSAKRTNSAKRVGPAKPEKRAERIPIMSPEKERFMAFEGLVQWTHAVVVQAARVSETLQHRLSLDLTERRLALGRRHTECNYFAIAANKPLEFKEWTLSFGLCTGVNFSEIDAFPPRDIKDLRNMREHVVDYFKGDGLVKKRWTIETPEYKADASAFIGALIGGRLDWSAFGAAAQRLLPRLLAEPIPFPSLANMPPHHQNQPYLYAYSNPLMSCSRQHGGNLHVDEQPQRRTWGHSNGEDLATGVSKASQR
jgi:hypothetical protein